MRGWAQRLVTLTDVRRRVVSRLLRRGTRWTSIHSLAPRRVVVEPLCAFSRLESRVTKGVCSVASSRTTASVSEIPSK